MQQTTDVGRGADPAGIERAKAPGFSIVTKLMIAFFGFVLVLGALLVLVYRQYVPALVLEQVELRAEAMTRSFAAAALQPVVERNYLRINKIAEATAALPDVAYASAINQRGIAVAGVFGDLDKFDRHFSALVKQTGFPKEIVEQNRLQAGQDFNKKRFEIGGHQVLDFAMRLENTGAQIRVGLFTDGVQRAIDNALVPLFILLGVMAVVGAVAFFLVASTVSRPIQELSRQVEFISMGHLDREIEVKAGGEIWLLAESFKRMQASIRYSIMQMRRRQAGQPQADKP